MSAKVTRMQNPRNASPAKELQRGMEDLAALVPLAVQFLADGIKDEDKAHAYRCATAILSHAARLEAFRDGRYTVGASAVEESLNL